MNKHLHTFHGGIHPPENKTQSTQTPIEPALLPDKLILPLQQHIGQQAQPLVSVGDRVLKGQMIAASVGYVSAPVHAPTSGTITAIEAHALPHPSGLSEQCIIITPDGQEEWAELRPLVDYQTVDNNTLLQHISNAGITGLGGAGFPSSVKLNPSEDLSIDTLILNAAECEPYITADDMLMRERAEEVVQGLHIIARILQPTQCLIGIENNKPKALDALHQAVESSHLKDQIRVLSIPTKYPSGGEKQLIQILTGREVPNGGIPADIGIVCHNVGTAVAIYRAVTKGEPLISRITTVTGDAVQRQGNIEVLLGTPIETLLAHFDVQQDQLHRVVMGGPMMGFTLDSVQLPVVKASNCILAATRKELPDPAPEQACIRCGMCAEACPATLLPQQLYWFSKSREFDKALSHNLLDCIECGACSYVCPSNIPLVQYYRFAKGEIRIEEHERTASDHARLRFEARQARLDQEEADKEAKRKARADAAAAKKASSSDADSSVADPKAAVIQAALERAQARKAKKAAAQADAAETSTTAATEAPAESALERAKARKAARATTEGTEKAPSTTEKTASGSAVERAKARKAALAAKTSEAETDTTADAATTNTDGMSALQRAQAKRALKSQQASTDEPENKSAATQSAVERAKARKAARAATEEDNVESAASKENKGETDTGMSALERAKAKRAQRDIEASTDKAEPATQSTSDDGLSALDRAKAKRAQREAEVKDNAADTEAVSENSTDAPLSALERAKAKRAQRNETDPKDAHTKSEASADTGLSALERAKAKRAQKSAADSSAADDSTVD